MLGRVHLITDSRPGTDPVRQVHSLIRAATEELVIQFRPADDWPDRLVYHQTLEILAMTSDLGVPVIVNDRIDIALAAGASGAHVGAQDLPVDVARRLLGPSAILGATARDAVTAKQAMLDGANYVGVGPCFLSSTKDGLPSPLGPSGLARVAPFAPVIAIGGVTLERVPSLLSAGAHGVAVVAAVADADDPCRALADLLEAVARHTAGSGPPVVAAGAAAGVPGVDAAGATTADAAGRGGERAVRS